MKKLACLHAHYSNINYINEVLKNDDLTVDHFVDPGLMNYISCNPNVNISFAKEKVENQLSWIEQSNPDAILITCTNYIALMDTENEKNKIPYIKIDEPFFKAICSNQEPQIMLFTNPSTVEGTISRLNQYAKNKQVSIQIETRIIPNVFTLLMNGQKKEHDILLSQYIESLIKKENKQISVAQLSMVEAVKQINQQNFCSILTPLDVLPNAIFENLKSL